MKKKKNYIPEIIKHICFVFFLKNYEEEKKGFKRIVANIIGNGHTKNHMICCNNKKDIASEKFRNLGLPPPPLNMVIVDLKLWHNVLYKCMHNI